MVDSGFHNDLFDGQFSDRKRKKPELLARISQQRVLPQVKVPVEYTVIMAIGVLVLVIVAYAVGVERGKRMVAVVPHVQAEVFEVYEDGGVEENNDVTYPVIKEEDIVVERDVTEVFESKGDDAADVVGRSEEAEVSEGMSSEGPEYQILLASVRSEEDAIREKDKLTEKGFDPDFVKIGEWYQVYAAGYRTRKAAEEAKKKLADEYSTCFIKRVR